MFNRNIYDQLKRDHRKVESLFRRIENPRHASRRLGLFFNLKDELLAHTKAEEEVFYSRLRSEEKTHHIALEAAEEHRLVKQLLGEVENISVDDEEWMTKIRVLKHLVMMHIREEELLLMKKARFVIDGAEARALKGQFAVSKADILAASPSPL